MKSEVASEYRIAVEILERTERDPVAFLRGILQFDPWERQVEIAETVAHFNKVAVRSCHDSGKTAIAARLALWFLFTHRPSIVVSTAPTFLQVQELLWREIAAGYHASTMPLGGKLYQTPLLEIGDRWFAIGLKPEERQPERFQGFHSENILFIADEASGVPESIFEAADGILTTANAKELLISNPTRLSGRLYDAFHSKSHLYKTIHIDGLETPNITAGENVRPYLITAQYIKEMIERYGEDSDQYRVKVRGEFPRAEERSLIPLEWVEMAVAKVMPVSIAIPSKVVAVDPARFGGDETAVIYREGDTVKDIRGWQFEDTMVTAGKVAALIVEKNADAVMVDVIGIGAGVADRLREQGFPVIEINVGEHAIDLKAFRRKRDELWWNLREKFRAGTISIPDDARLRAQLTAPTYTFSSAGQIVVESKDDIKERLGESPDRADALVLAFAMEPPRRAVDEGYAPRNIFREAFYPEHRRRRKTWR